MKKGENVLVGGNEDHPAVINATRVLNEFLRPAMKQVMRGVRESIPGLRHAILILHTDEGRVATVMGTCEDTEETLRVIAAAQALIETQKVKS